MRIDEPAYAMDIDNNPEASSTNLRYTYASLTTPTITYEVDSRTGKRTVLKRTPAPNYDPPSVKPTGCSRQPIGAL